jgi:hypothetical protein
MATSANIRHVLYKSPTTIADPGYSATESLRTITVDKDGGVCPIVTTGTGDTRTLARPTKAGIDASLVLYTDGGNLTLTVTGGYNADADTSITFYDAGNFVRFMSIDVGGTYYWRIISQYGTSADVAAGDLMAPSTVIDATIEQYVSSVRRDGHFIKTAILIDLTGAASTTTDKDIIGAAGACHFGQITTAINGTILCGQMSCLEVPATGADDIDLYMASVGTGAYDADGSGLTNAASLITKGGAWALQTPGLGTAMTAKVTADYYLYLLNGEAGTVGTYSAGKFLIELWGI